MGTDASVRMLRALSLCRRTPPQVQRWAPAAFKVPVRGFAESGFLPQAVVEERVLETLKTFEKVDAGKLSSDSHFKNDLGLDSPDAVEVVMAIEEEFNVEIPDADAEKIHPAQRPSSTLWLTPKLNKPP